MKIRRTVRRQIVLLFRQMTGTYHIFTALSIFQDGEKRKTA